MSRRSQDNEEGKAPRQGWSEAFLAAGPSAQDKLLFGSGFGNEFDREEWQWHTDPSSAQTSAI